MIQPTEMRRTLTIGALAAVGCLGALGCMTTSGPLPVRNEEGPIPPHIANQQTPRGTVGAFAPWITEGRPGVFTPSDDFKTGEIYGLAHGVGFTGGGARFVAEQWLLMKDSVEKPYNGVTLVRFPGFLPLADKDPARGEKLVWGFGRYPLGFAAPAMDVAAFYEWAVPVVAPRVNPVIYAFGFAGLHKGMPPERLSKTVIGDPIDPDTDGYVETFNITNGCRLTMFIESGFSAYANTTSWPFLSRFERSRRLLQAYDAKGCSNGFMTDAGASTARVVDAARTKYRDWHDIIKAWTDAEVGYADGSVLIDDNFTGEPADFGDLKNVAPLLAPSK